MSLDSWKQIGSIWFLLYLWEAFVCRESLPRWELIVNDPTRNLRSNPCVFFESFRRDLNEAKAVYISEYDLLFFSQASEWAGILNPRIWLANRTLVTGPAFYGTAHRLNHKSI